MYALLLSLESPTWWMNSWRSPWNCQEHPYISELVCYCQNCSKSCFAFITSCTMPVWIIVWVDKIGFSQIWAEMALSKCLLSNQTGGHRIGDCRWQFALLSDKCNNRVSGGKYNKTEWCWWRVCIRWYEAITAETEEYFTINWWIKLASKSEWTDVNGMSRALSPRYYRMLSVYSEVTSNGTTKYTPLHQVTRCRCRVTVAPELTCRTPIAPKIHNNSKDEHLMCN
jgi:hypothetical protein